ncbi:MAG: hypothetical protein ACREGR_04935 [Minisyncoccia bacterium]
MNESHIEKTVMRRVYRLRALEAVFSGTTVALLLLVAALWLISREVWVAMVFTNGPHTFVGHSLYLVYAFEHTRLFVQALCLLVLISLIYLAREAAHRISYVLAPLSA